MNISIVIPTSAALPHIIDQTIQSCLDQVLDSFLIEIIVVCNPPNSGLKSQLKEKFGHKITYIEINQMGANYARNKGWDHAQYDLIYFLDDDCVLPNNSHLLKLVLSHLKYPKASVIGAGYQSTSKTNFWGAKYNELVKYWVQLHHSSSPFKVVPGGNLSLKKKNFLPNERFDKSLKYGGTETEFLIRIQKNTHIVEHDPNLSVWHITTPTLFKIIRKAWLQGRNKISQGIFLRPSIKHIPLPTVLFLGGYKMIVETAAIVEKILKTKQNL